MWHLKKQVYVCVYVTLLLFLHHNLNLKWNDEENKKTLYFQNSVYKTKWSKEKYPFSTRQRIGIQFARSARPPIDKPIKYSLHTICYFSLNYIFQKNDLKCTHSRNSVYSRLLFNSMHSHGVCELVRSISNNITFHLLMIPYAFVWSNSRKYTEVCPYLHSFCRKIYWMEFHWLVAHFLI